MDARIQLRNDTDANWTSINPILAIGEAGYATDTLVLKLGDGVTAWNTLNSICIPVLNDTSKLKSVDVQNRNLYDNAGNLIFDWQNGAWTQTAMTNASYQTIWLAAMPCTSDTGSQNYRFIWIQGQANNTVLATEQALTPSSVNLGTLSTYVPELVFIAKVIINYTPGGGGNWTIEEVDIITGTKYSQSSSGNGTFLTAVSTNSSLSGAGTASSPLAISFDSTSTNIKVDGTQSAGSSGLACNSDHVHPTDTSRVSTGTTVNGKALSGNITLTLASSDFASQGTTNTVLHGITSGNPAFSAVVEADITLADNTTNNVSTSAHGFIPKAPNDATQFFRGDGAWGLPTFTLPSGLIIIGQGYGTTASSRGANQVNAYRYKALKTGSISQLGICLYNSLVNSSHLVLGIYTEGGTNSPVRGTLLGQTAQYTSSANEGSGELIISLNSPVSLTAKTPYWICIHSDQAVSCYVIDTGTLGSYGAYKAVTYNSTLPSTFPSGINNDSWSVCFGMT
ncbi:MAG: hypothetical protein ABSG25_01475 [Bryobacteraceae bacterium]